MLDTKQPRRTGIVFWRDSRVSYNEYDNNANRLSDVYELIVPKGQCFQLGGPHPFRVRLYTEDDELTPSGKTVTVSYPIAVPVDPDGDSLDPDDFIVLTGVVSGTRQRLTIDNDNCDLANKVVAFTETLDADTKVTAYYPPKSGLVVLAVKDPRSIGARPVDIVREDHGIMVERNYFKRGSGAYIESKIAVPPDWIIAIQLDAPWTVAFTDDLASPGALTGFVKIDIPVIFHPRIAFPHNYEEVLRQELSRY